MALKSGGKFGKTCPSCEGILTPFEVEDGHGQKVSNIWKCTKCGQMWDFREEIQWE